MEFVIMKLMSVLNENKVINHIGSKNECFKNAI